MIINIGFTSIKHYLNTHGITLTSGMLSAIVLGTIEALENETKYDTIPADYKLKLTDFVLPTEDPNKLVDIVNYKEFIADCKSLVKEAIGDNSTVGLGVVDIHTVGDRYILIME